MALTREEAQQKFKGEIQYSYIEEDGRTNYCYGTLWSLSCFANKDDPDDYIWIRSESYRPLKFNEVSWDINDVHPFARMRREKITDWSKVSVMTKE